jgi:hypothetical protein
MENHHFSWENPLYMVIFNSYVKLPEGTPTPPSSNHPILVFSFRASSIRLGTRIAFWGTASRAPQERKMLLMASVGAAVEPILSEPHHVCSPLAARGQNGTNTVIKSKQNIHTSSNHHTTTIMVITLMRI